MLLLPCVEFPICFAALLLHLGMDVIAPEASRCLKIFASHAEILVTRAEISVSHTETSASQVETSSTHADVSASIDDISVTHTGFLVSHAEILVARAETSIVRVAEKYTCKEGLKNQASLLFYSGTSA